MGAPRRRVTPTSAPLVAPGLAAEGSPAVGVIVVNHEREHEAVAAVRSALDQDYAGSVIVYFVYNRRAGVERILERLPGEVVTIPYTVSAGENPIACKRNLALGVSAEPLIAFLDDDDLWDRRKLSSQVACLLLHPEAILCCTAWKTLAGRPVSSWSTFSMQLLSSWSVALALSVATSSTLVRGDAVRRERFDERPSRFGVEDYDLWLRLLVKGQFWRIEAELTILRPDGNSASSLDRASQHGRAAGVAAEELRRRGVHPQGVAALLWFLGLACMAERGGRPSTVAPAALEEILDGTVLGRMDPLLIAIAERLLKSRLALRLGRLGRSMAHSGILERFDR